MSYLMAREEHPRKDDPVIRYAKTKVSVPTSRRGVLLCLTILSTGPQGVFLSLRGIDRQV